MTSLTPDEWARITTHFDELRQLEAAERRARLDLLALADPMVASEVLALLDADADDAFMESESGGALSHANVITSRLIGQTVGTYRIEREIGHGGMGVVYEARHVDPSLDKHVAIKTLAIGLNRPELAWRFRRERQILARLEHPNIAALYDGGSTEDGLPYLVMEYVDGLRIDQWCDQQQRSIAERIDLFRQVCAAVHFAHTKLIVHRDLKPGNILVTRDGVVKLLDFGIAKLVLAEDESDDSSAELTRAGMVPHTTTYASPEQLRGHDVTTVSDVYSLGVVLYRLLTGAVPPAGDTRASSGTLAQGSVTPPSEAATAAHAAQCGLPGIAPLRDALRGELDAIVLMALRDEPERRYASAEAFSADLLRFLKGMTVQAKPDTLGYRMRKFVRRQRALVAASVIAVVALVGGAVSSTLAARAARVEADRTARVARVLQGLIGSGASTQYTSVPTLLTVLDSARSTVATEFADDDRARADAYDVFAGSYFGFQRPDLALLMLDSARLLHAQTTGPASVEVARDLAASADVVIALGATDSAFARHRLAVQMMRQLRPVPERELNDAEVELSFNEINLLQDASALPRMVGALERERRAAQPRWDMIAMGEAAMILPYFNQKRPEAADSAYIRSEEALLRDTTATQRYKTALAFQGQSLLVRGRPAAAEPKIRQLLVLTERRLGAGHYLTAQAQNLLARVMLPLGRYAEGRALIDSAIANNEAAVARDPMYLGEMYVTRTGFETKLHDWPAAEASLAKAAALRDKLGAQRPILTVSIQYTTAALEEERGRVEQARATFTRAAALARETLPPGAKNIGLAEEKLRAFTLRHPVAAAR
jgi:serine/threonine-protein kinase